MGWLKHLLAAALVAYPLLVYALHDTVPTFVFVTAVLALVGSRLALSQTPGQDVWRYPLVFVLIGVAAFTLVDFDLAARAYPALMAFGFAALFGYTLLRPPTLIERLARFTAPDLSADGVGYCRNVTIVWTLYCLLNGIVAALTALFGSWELWSLWTGVISYVGMGILFVGEMVLRRRFRGTRA